MFRQLRGRADYFPVARLASRRWLCGDVAGGSLSAGSELLWPGRHGGERLGMVPGFLPALGGRAEAESAGCRFRQQARLSRWQLEIQVHKFARDGAWLE